MTADPLLTISGSPGLYYFNPAAPNSGVATLTLVPQVHVLTGDDAPGAELVDAVLSMLLAHGFALVTELGSGGVFGITRARRLDGRAVLGSLRARSLGRPAVL